MKKRISISGKIAAGKTTCSEYLIQQYGYQRVSFATPIKSIVEWFKSYTLSPFTEGHQQLESQNQLFKYLVKVNLDNYVNASRCFDILIDEIFPRYTDINWNVEKSDRWRQLLQEIGDGLRAKVNPSIWMDYLVASLDQDGLYICDDMRYQNEYETMRRAGFTLVRLQISPEMQRDRVQRIYGNVDPQRFEHPSETDLDHMAFPHVLNADQDLVYLLHDLRSIAECEEAAVKEG